MKKISILFIYLFNLVPLISFSQIVWLDDLTDINNLESFHKKCIEENLDFIGEADHEILYCDFSNTDPSNSDIPRSYIRYYKPINSVLIEYVDRWGYLNITGSLKEEGVFKGIIQLLNYESTDFVNHTLSCYELPNSNFSGDYICFGRGDRIQKGYKVPIPVSRVVTIYDYMLDRGFYFYDPNN